MVLANINPFRSCEAHSGTAFEIDFAIAMGKRVIAYLSDSRPPVVKLADHSAGTLTRQAGRISDPAGRTSESLDIPVNLMLGISCEMIEGGLFEALEHLSCTKPSDKAEHFDQLLSRN